MGVARFERFFRAAAGLDVDKDDLERHSDFINQKLYDLLIVGQATARANRRDVIEPQDLPITKGLQESVHAFGEIDQEIELQPILEHLATQRPMEAALGEATQSRLPGIAGGAEHRPGPHLHHHRPEAPESPDRALAARVSHLRPAALALNGRGAVAEAIHLGEQAWQRPRLLAGSRPDPGAWSRRLVGLRRVLPGDHQLVVLGVHPHGGAIADVPAQQRPADAGLDLVGDEPA